MSYIIQLNKLEEVQCRNERIEIFENLPKYIKDYPLEYGGIWKSTELTTLRKRIKELEDILEKIIREGGGGHIMESPGRFISEFTEFVERLRYKQCYLRQLWRSIFVGITIRNTLLELYTEVKYRPGNTGFEESRVRFELNKSVLI
jgi:hypothetical protein